MSSPTTLPGLLRQLREDSYVNGWDKPGFLALAANRIGKWARTLPPPARAPIAFLAHLIFVFERNIYGIELPWQATVGRRVVIAHQGGIVLHPNVVIGDDCVLRHNVTIGAGPGPNRAQVPVLGNGVDVGAGAVIVGNITVGDGARIGPNAVVVTDVPPGAYALAAPARVAREERADPAMGETGDGTRE